MNDGHVLERPACPRLCLDPFKLALGHAGEMLQRHRGHAVIAAQPADGTDKQRDAAHCFRLQGTAFRADVEILCLHPHRH